MYSALAIFRAVILHKNAKESIPTRKKNKIILGKEVLSELAKSINVKKTFLKWPKIKLKFTY